MAEMRDIVWPVCVCVRWMARQGETKIFNSSVSLAVSPFSGLSRMGEGFKPIPTATPR